MRQDIGSEGHQGSHRLMSCWHSARTALNLDSERLSRVLYGEQGTPAHLGLPQPPPKNRCAQCASGASTRLPPCTNGRHSPNHTGSRCQGRQGATKGSRFNRVLSPLAPAAFARRLSDTPRNMSTTVPQLTSVFRAF